MTVRELFEAEKLTLDTLNNIRDESYYWEGAAVFVMDNWGRQITELSDKQVAWLDRIHEDMVEKRIEGKL